MNREFEALNEMKIGTGLAATAGSRYAESVGNQLFVAGRVLLGVGGRLIGSGDPYAQTRPAARTTC